MVRPRTPVAEILSSAEQWIGTKEAAAILGVSVSTIQKMVETGKLRAWRTQGGHRRVSEADVRMLNRQKRQIALNRSPVQALQLLVVEDNPTVAKAIAGMIEQWGPCIEATFVRGATEALEQMERHKPDLIVTDLSMQPLDGFHLIRTLRASRDLVDTRILVLTGMRPEDIEARGGLDKLVICYEKPQFFARLSGYIDARLQDKLH
jgi:excisionase family DNA binding protein